MTDRLDQLPAILVRNYKLDALALTLDVSAIATINPPVDFQGISE